MSIRFFDHNDYRVIEVTPEGVKYDIVINNPVTGDTWIEVILDPANPCQIFYDGTMLTLPGSTAGSCDICGRDVPTMRHHDYVVGELAEACRECAESSRFKDWK